MALRFPPPWYIWHLRLFFLLGKCVFLCTLARLGWFQPVWPFFGYEIYIEWRSCSVGAWPCVRRLWIVFFFRQFQTQKGGHQWTAHRWGFLHRTILHKCYFVFWLICGCGRWVFHWDLTWVNFDTQIDRNISVLPYSKWMVFK